MAAPTFTPEDFAAADDLPSADLPSGPVMFVAEVIAEAIGTQRTIEDKGNGDYWLAGGCTPQSAGCVINLRDVAEEVLRSLPTCGYGPRESAAPATEFRTPAGVTIRADQGEGRTAEPVTGCPSVGSAVHPREAVLSACAEFLGERPTDETRSLTDLGADSLDVVEITMKVEEDLLIGLDDSDIGMEMTVGDLIALVERLRAEAVPQSQMNGVA